MPLADISFNPVSWWWIAIWFLLGSAIVTDEIRRRIDEGTKLRRWLTDSSAVEPPEFESTPPFFADPWIAALLFLALSTWLMGHAHHFSPPVRMLILILNIALCVGVGFSSLSRPATGQRSSSYVGLAALTVAWISLGLVGGNIAWSNGGSRSKNIILAALAVMTASWWWSWLSVVWRQQLDHDRPWTPTGSLIPTARRFALACHLLAVAVAVVCTSSPPSEIVKNPSMGYHVGLITLWIGLFLAAIGYRIQQPTPVHRAWPLLTFLAFLGAMMLRWNSN